MLPNDTCGQSHYTPGANEDIYGKEEPRQTHDDFEGEEDDGEHELESEYDGSENNQQSR